MIRNIHTGVLSVECVDGEQSKLFIKLSDGKKSEKPIEKKYFLTNVGFLLENFLMILKVIYFQ